MKTYTVKFLDKNQNEIRIDNLQADNLNEARRSCKHWLANSSDSLITKFTITKA